MKVSVVLDPGVNRAGIAIFRDGILTDAGCLNSKLRAKDDIIRRCNEMAGLALAYCEARLSYSDMDPSAEFVSEWMQIYRAGKSKGSPNDILKVAGVATAIGALLCSVFDMECHSYLPKEWTGGIKKFETVRDCKKSPRALKIISRLSPEEMEVWDAIKYHDAIDAVGIGLHHLKRFQRRRVFPRE